MGIEEPKEYTPEEIAEMEKSRTISDAELLKGGAEYSVNEGGEKENLLITDRQKQVETHEHEDEREALLLYEKIGSLLEQRIDAGDIIQLMEYSSEGRYPGVLNQEQADFLRKMRQVIKEYGESPDEVLANKSSFTYFIWKRNTELGNKLVSNLHGRKYDDGYSFLGFDDWGDGKQKYRARGLI